MEPWFIAYFFDVGYLLAQSIRFPVSRDRIVGSSLGLVEVTCFLNYTAHQVNLRVISG